MKAQRYLDIYFPKSMRSSMNSLSIDNLDLESELDLSDFVNLESFNGGRNRINNFNLSKNTNLIYLELGSNELTDLDFLNSLPNPEKLIDLSVSNNNINSTNLEVFERFVNLEHLKVGNDDEERIKKNIYNRFCGSLEPLKYLVNLEHLCIESTDVDDGLEYLSDSLNEAQYDTDTESSGAKGRVWCSPKRRPGSKVARIKERLKPFNFNLGLWKEEYKNKIKLETRQLSK